MARFGLVRMHGATMKLMTKKFLPLLVGVVFLAVPLVAQEQPQPQFPNEPYEFILAKLAASDGRYDEALSRMDRVIEKNPGNPVLLFERAMMFIDAGRIDKAETELRNVVKTNPDFYDAQKLLGRVLLDRAGTDRTKMGEALEHLQAALKVNPDDVITGITVSQLLVSTGKVAEAEKVLATLVERSPDQRALNYNYAQVLTKLGRGDESRKYLERAVEVDPTFGPAILQLIDIYQRENEWAKAADVLQPLIDDDPANIELQRQQAYFFLRAGNPAKARTMFETMVKADPKDQRSLFYLAESLNDLEQYAEADKIYRKLLEETPDDPDLLFSFSLSQIGQKKYDEAEKALNTLLKVQGIPAGMAMLGRTQLALIDLQRGNYDAAINTARPVFIWQDKPNPQAINIALDALRKQKKYAEGVTLLQPLVDKYSTEPFVNARYVEMLTRAGQKEKAAQAAAVAAKFGTPHVVATAEALLQAENGSGAVQLVRQAIAAKPDDVDLQYELGSLQERSDDKAGAEKTFLSILAKHPEHGATLNYLGYMWAEKGENLDRAQEMLTKAVSQEPQNGAYVDSLGWVYFRQGKLDLAEKTLRDATRLLPHDATVHEHLGDVLAQRGDNVRALQVYRTALTLEPEPKDEAKIRTKIAEIERKAQTSQR